MTKQEIKREKIIQSAIEIFSKDGFHNSKITKIAELSGIATGSIYLYFSNKEQILEIIFLRVWSIMAEKFKELSTDDSLSDTQKVIEFVLFIAGEIRENRNIAPIILQEYQFWNTSRSEELQEKIKISFLAISNIISDGIKRGEFRPTLDPKTATAFLTGGIWFILEYWTDNFSTVSYETIESQLKDLASHCLK